MGLGAWLAAKTEAKHFQVEEARERREVREMPHAEEEEIYEIFGNYGIPRANVGPIVEALKKDEDMWVKVCDDVGERGVRWMLTGLVYDGFRITACTAGAVTSVDFGAGHGVDVFAWGADSYDTVLCVQ
tara:strand:+ start:17903 stop:18289 length:387 start_codon:yes stop_codon:yes gene_type:complete